MAVFVWQGDRFDDDPFNTLPPWWMDAATSSGNLPDDGQRCEVMLPRDWRCDEEAEVVVHAVCRVCGPTSGQFCRYCLRNLIGSLGRAGRPLFRCGDAGAAHEIVAFKEACTL